MTKRLGVLGAVIALMALVVGVVSPALGSSGDDDKQRTIRVVAITTEEEFLDFGAEDFSLGDQIVFSANLLKAGTQVGRLGVVCTIVSLEQEQVQCLATADLRGGQIAVHGLLTGEPETFVLPITGGSGKYEGAEGEVQVRQVTETKEILTFHVEV